MFVSRLRGGRLDGAAGFSCHAVGVSCNFDYGGGDWHAAMPGTISEVKSIS
jgi:hypothetical protein